MGLSFRQYSAKNDLMKNKISKIIFVVSVLKVIFVVSLFLSFFLWSLPLLTLNSGIWEFFQERSGIVLNGTDVKTYNEHVIDFFFNNVTLNFLNVNESGHMQDVKNMLTVVNGLALFSFVSVISNLVYLSKKDKGFLIRAIRKISLIVFCITLIFSLIMLTNFYSVFTYFHELVFVKNFAFPSSSLLKTLYPDEFFYQVSSFYVLSILIVSLVVAVISHRLKLK